MDFLILQIYLSDPDSRNWQIAFNNSNTIFSDSTLKKIYPGQAIQKFKSVEDSMKNAYLWSLGTTQTHMEDKNIAPYINVTLPYKFGDIFSGYLKFGGMYRERDRNQTVVSGTSS